MPTILPYRHPAHPNIPVLEGALDIPMKHLCNDLGGWALSGKTSERTDIFILERRQDFRNEFIKPYEVDYASVLIEFTGSDLHLDIPLMLMELFGIPVGSIEGMGSNKGIFGAN